MLFRSPAAAKSVASSWPCRTQPTRRLTLRSIGQPPGYRCPPLNSNVSALQRSMKKSPVRSLASGCAATQRAGRKSCTSMHSGIGAARYVALREVWLSLHGSLRAEGVTGERLGFSRGVFRLRSTAVPRHRAIHSGSCPRKEQYEYGPNLKYEHQDQHNAQSCGLAPLTCSRCKWHSGCAERQFNQRANPSFKRSCQGLRPCPAA